MQIHCTRDSNRFPAFQFNFRNMYAKLSKFVEINYVNRLNGGINSTFHMLE